MNDYEAMKNEFAKGLTETVSELTIEQLQKVLSCLDVCASSYNVQKAVTTLSVPSGDVPELVKVYIATKTIEGLSKGTVENMLYTLKRFYQYVNKPFEAVTTQDIRVFLFQYQQDNKVSNATLDKIRGNVCTFFHWIAAENYISRDPAMTIKPMKTEKKQRLSLNQMELELIRNACKTIREKAMIEFMYSTGCRVSELIGAKISDVDFTTGEVHLFGKGQKHRTSYINAKCHVTLKEYLDSRNDKSEYLFVSSKRPHDKLCKESVEVIIKNICSRTTITKPVTPHIFRHTTATQAVRHGMPVEEVRKLLGHENISTTMVYVETMEGDVHTSHMKAVV